MPPAARRLVQGLVAVQLCCAATYLEVALRRRPFPRLAAGWSAAATSSVGRRLPLAAGLLDAERLQRLVGLAARCWRADRGCLPRALLTWWIELARGERAAIVVGVRREPFAAHAWVEVGGRVPGEAGGAPARFHELVRYGPPPGRTARP
jgi:Transglutaminase-like superfamily